MRALLSLFALINLSGCIALAAGGAAGAGAFAYLNGNYTVTEDANMDAVWDASLEAISDISFGIKSKKRDGLHGTIKAEGADGTALTIDVDRKAESKTEIVIRYGLLGDQDKSNYVHEKIKGKLR